MRKSELSKTFRLKHVLTLWVALCSTTALAQQGYSIKGSAADTASFNKMFNSTVYVLNARDSVIQQYTYTDGGGTFVVKSLPSGKFILLVTYPDYADYAETFTLDTANPLHDFGKINMQPRSRLLQEVLIKGKVTAIKIKGDTTEFNAKAYVIQPNDKVEDLLRQLPGLQIDRNGKITANGETVTKVLLDGEEFFGDDPKLITRNIRADMVDKIQLYDKKSDQATFTGIDDGVKTKTINVKLREDKNKGMFGKLEAGAGNPDLYEGQALYNHFKPGERYAAYATAATTGKVSIGQGDNNRIGAASNVVQVGDVMIVPAGVADEQDGFNGTYNGRGFPTARTGGIHYDAKWNTNKDILNANYKVGYLDVNGQNKVTTDRALPSATLHSNTNKSFDNSAFRQKLDGSYTFSPDTISNLKITADGTLKYADTKSNYFTTTSRDGMLLNQNTQSQSSHDDIRIFNMSTFYTRKLKEGRTFSWAVSTLYNNNKTSGYQNSALDFYNASGAKDSTTHIDQYKTTNLSVALVSSNITYTQPLSKAIALVFNYGIGINNSHANRNTFRLSPSGRYDQPDSVYSNNYQFNQLTNQVGSVLSYHPGKSVINVGTRLYVVDFKQHNLNNGSIFRRDFLNWAPQLNYSLRISQAQNVSVNYYGSTIQPTIDQVQPVRVNDDPLNVILGNPVLQPSFSHRMNVRYRGSGGLGGIFITLSGMYGFNPNAIVNTVNTSSTGKTTVLYTNLQGATPNNYSFSGNLSFNIKPLKMNVEMELDASGDKGYSYSNNVLVTSTSNNYSGYVQLRKSKVKTYDLSFVIGPTYTLSNFSLQNQNNNAGGLYSDAWAQVYLPGKFIIFTSYNYNYRGATQSFEAQSRFIWNASLSQTFLKNEALKLSLAVNDLLNQNAILNRNITATSITQSSYSSIRRYFFLSLSWDFSKFGPTTQKQ
ncbi:outer membrane beta-barrel protein [Mucilaginibacter sp. UYCu711]|uniref:outer membrane beta-barrel protein n=1 Tax=Mucilaginibacter sp. UYCu711 TaxID=3156339 RepID=UPI003D22FC00